MGTELSGRYEITLSGKEKEPFFGKLERVTQWKKEIEGKFHEINVYRFMSKRASGDAYFYSVDEDISVEGETISMKDTILGSKRLMRYATLLMMVIDAVFMYLMYSFASAGFVMQYSPSMALVMYMILAGAAMATIIFIIYWWYSSQVTVFSLDLRPLVEEYSSFLIPVYMTNSSRNPPEKYLLEISQLTDNALKSIDASMRQLGTHLVNVIGMESKKKDDIIESLKESSAALTAQYKDVKTLQRGASTRTVSSYFPVMIAVAVVVIGFVALYMVFG